MIDGFQRVLDHIRSIAGSEFEKRRLFERLMKRYFQQDPLYRDRFSKVWLWSDWAATRPDFPAKDTTVLDRRQRGFRGAGLPGRGIQLDPCLESTGECTDFWCITAFGGR